MKKHFISIPVLLLMLSLSVWGCKKEEPEAEAVTVPDTVIEEVVTEDPVIE